MPQKKLKRKKEFQELALKYKQKLESEDPAAARRFLMEGMAELYELHDIAAEMNESKGSGVSDFKRHRDKLAEIRSRATASNPNLKESDGEVVPITQNEPFVNWGGTVQNTPSYTAWPSTVGGVQTVVRDARDNNKKVRVAGYRHTWDDMYSSDGEILISLFDPVYNELPSVDIPFNNNFSDPTLLTGIINQSEAPDGSKAVYRIGASTTNDQFRQWAVGDGISGNEAQSWTVPLNVIMVEITYGGSNSPICHGAGINNKTLSDLVTAIEIVDANGEHQTVSDPVMIKSAAGSFGLLGIVVAVHLELDKMTFARLDPKKKDLFLTLPPAGPGQVPEELLSQYFNTDQTEMANAWTEFQRAASEDYYSEWFWFTFNQDCWINTWKNVLTDGSDPGTYPTHAEVAKQEAAETAAYALVQSPAFNNKTEIEQAQILSNQGMDALPDQDEVDDNGNPVYPKNVWLTDALHFQRGIQNMPVWDMEWELEVPYDSGTGTYDWSVCQSAWWAAINVVYDWKNRSKAPMRLTLEMRVMGGSDVILAPQHGYPATCSIEVLTTTNTNETDWYQFMQDITDAWRNVRGSSGAQLGMRPHWAKQWNGLIVDGIPISLYLQATGYLQEIMEFKQHFQMLQSSWMVSLDEAQERFGNDTLNAVLGSIYDPIPIDADQDGQAGDSA